MQGFAALVALGQASYADAVVTHASANLAEIAGPRAAGAPGRMLSAWMRPDERHQLLSLADGLAEGASAVFRLDRRARRDGSGLAARLTRRRGRILLELEAVPDEAAAGAPRRGPALGAGADRHALLDTCVQEVRRVSGYDRVMAYRFHPDWSGEVVAEARAPELEPFLGLRYPASDIPAVARDLYLDNRLRVLADVDGPAVAIEAMDGAEPPDSLDIGTAVSRSMSPVHLQYLRNMGVAASLVASLVANGRLWGLIACHHGRPRTAHPRVREAVAALAERLSSDLESLELRSARAGARAARERLGRVRDALAGARDPAVALLFGAGGVASALDADGAALVAGDDVAQTGLAPSQRWLRGFAGWMVGNGVRTYWTEAAHADGGPFAAPDGGVAGIAATVVASRPPLVVAAFTGEVVDTVRWGGDPGEADGGAAADGPIAPRRSFAEWRQTVRGRSRPWSACELEVLDRLSRTIGPGGGAAVASALATLAARAGSQQVVAPALADAAMQGLGLVVRQDGGRAAPHVLHVGRGMRDLLADADGETDGVRLAVLLRRLGLDGSMSGSGDLPAPIEREVASRGAGSRVVRIAFGRLLEASSRGRRARLLTLSCLDVTEFRRFEETLQAATARAEEASRMKSTFLANMSHELRTPLNAILGFSEILAAELFGPLGSGRYLDYVRDIHAAGGHLLSLVDDILDLSRLSSGGRQLDLGPVDLAAALGAAASMVSANARSRGVALSFDRPETGVTVLADERAVRQVALNLLTNAIKFTPSGGRVTMRIEVGERSVVFEVADTGAGIPSDQLDAVFRPFHQVSAVQSRDHGGAGLGLAICRALLDLHGGGIGLESRPGDGTRARAWLPRTPMPVLAA